MDIQNSGKVVFLIQIICQSFCCRDGLHYIKLTIIIIVFTRAVYNIIISEFLKNFFLIVIMSLSN